MWYLAISPTPLWGRFEQKNIHPWLHLIREGVIFFDFLTDLSAKNWGGVSPPPTKIVNFVLQNVKNIKHALNLFFCWTIFLNLKLSISEPSSSIGINKSFFFVKWAEGGRGSELRRRVFFYALPYQAPAHMQSLSHDSSS